MACDIPDNLLQQFQIAIDAIDEFTPVPQQLSSLTGVVNGLLNKCNLIYNGNDVTTNSMSNYAGKIASYESAVEQNNNSMMLYLNDYYYIIFKTFIYICVLCIVFYFFGLSKVTEIIKISSNVIKEKIGKVKEINPIKEKINTNIEPKIL